MNTTTEVEEEVGGGGKHEGISTCQTGPLIHSADVAPDVVKLLSHLSVVRKLAADWLSGLPCQLCEEQETWSCD